MDLPARGAAHRRGAVALSAAITLNGRAAVRAQIGGVERYAREVTSRLVALAPQRYKLLGPPPALAHRAGHLWEQLVLPAVAARSALLYSPANLAPAAYPNNVIVIHDAAALRRPEAYSSRYVRYQRTLLPLLARRARLVLTDSQFGRDEVLEVLRADPARVRIVPAGVDERFSPEAASAGGRSRYGLSKPYVLAVGTASARKNFELLAEVAPLLERRGLELVAAGSDRGYLRGGASGLRRLGYVDDALLPGLYAGAAALAMPSSYEGFGLPCLEAMATGTPVVIAPTPALLETCADAALVADGQPQAFAEALVAAASDDGVRDPLIAAGLRRAREFSWDRTAEETDRVLSELLATRQ